MPLPVPEAGVIAARGTEVIVLEITVLVPTTVAVQAHPEGAETVTCNAETLPVEGAPEAAN